MEKYVCSNCKKSKVSSELPEGWIQKQVSDELEDPSIVWYCSECKDEVKNE